jgi:hypothetical protein
MPDQVKEAKKKEQTQMAILARIKKEQAEEAKKAKKIEAETESKNAEKEAAAVKVQEVRCSPLTMLNSKWRLRFAF